MLDEISLKEVGRPTGRLGGDVTTRGDGNKASPHLPLSGEVATLFLRDPLSTKAKGESQKEKSTERRGTPTTGNTDMERTREEKTQTNLHEEKGASKNILPLCYPATYALHLKRRREVSTSNKTIKE